MISISQPEFGEAELNAVAAVLQSGQIAQGERVAEFEMLFADYCGAAEAIAVSSGTAALYLVLMAHNIGPGDTVITTPFSFFSSASTILMTGALPVFADIRSDSFNLNVESAEALIDQTTKAILPVDLYGHPAEMERFQNLADQNGLALIEDACQAHGAMINGRKTGSFGTGCFSFYATKNMSTGEGGMVTTGDSNIANKIRMLRNHGMQGKNIHDSLGYNFRMTELAAALGIVQLNRLDNRNQKRRANAEELSTRLGGYLTTPVEIEGYRHVFHQYTVRVEAGMRNQIRDQLLQRGIASEIFYPKPLYRISPVSGTTDKRLDTCPIAEQACSEVLSLPVHPGLDFKSLAIVADAVIDSLSCSV